jgi:acyl transferase domain-containing protein/NADPH:quinone reductase-like Zn-dependent oxidoreductase/acyl carrier protein
MVIIRWGKFLGVMPAVPPLLEAYASQKAVSSGATPAGEKRPVSLETIMRALESTIGCGVDPDAPLMEAGLDSLGAVELGNQLQQESGQTLPSTLIFDYPTARQLAQYFEGVSAEANAVVGSDSSAAASAMPPSKAPAVSSSGRASTLTIRPCGVSAMLPGRAERVSALARMSACGADVISEVPLSRWQLGALGLPVGVVSERARHGGFMVDADLFDNSFFGVSPAEAGAMDPQQRLLLERGYEALHGASFDKPILMNSVAGVFLGIAANDFAEVVRTTPSLARSVYAATGSSHSVASGRISFVLGMQGPCVSYDTACSAALAAHHAALRSLQHRECISALSIGVSMMLLPGVGITFATASMLSAHGHCHTFDARADGYVRGEACGAVALGASGFGERDTLRVMGSCVRQDGRSASLTAPNGQAQRALLWAALADAAMMSEQVSCVEAHGTGTGLGDPIETRSLSGLLSSREDDEALALGSIKANVGHAEPAAGITGLLRLSLGLRQSVCPPNGQLHTINPHVQAALQNVACMLPVQHSQAPSCEAQEVGSLAGGVSSFGYSGTIVHAVMQEDRADGAVSRLAPPARPSFTRRRFPWREPTHPLIQVAASAVGGQAACFSSPALGALRELVVDHVVQGRVVFPAAGYLEMVRAACGSSRMVQRRVFFLQPLLVDGDGKLSSVLCELSESEERFEVLSVLDEEATRTAHCGGSLGAPASDMEGRSPFLLAVREACASTADVGSLYAGFRSMGLEYGPGYRMLARTWAGRAMDGAVGRLQRRTRRDGTLVHPADLDGALQLTALLALGSAAEMRLPFSVAEATLHSAFGRIWPIAERDGASAAGIAMVCEGRRGGSGVRLKGFETRAFKAASARPTAVRQPHLYITSWPARKLTRADGAASSLGSLMLSATGRAEHLCANDIEPRGCLAGSLSFAFGLGGGMQRLDSLAALTPAFDVVRTHSERPVLPVWLVTCGGFGARSAATGMPAHAGVLGLARQARSEAPTSCAAVIDVDTCATPGIAVSKIAASLGLCYAGLPEPEIALDGVVHRVPRLAAAAVSLSGPVRMHFDARGAVSGLRIVPQEDISQAPMRGEVELHVRAVGLNFRDVLNVLGVYPGDPGPPGSDCAAHVARCGASSAHLKVGDSVVGHGLAALASIARSDSRLMAAMDSSLTVEQACTLPTTWCTVHVALLASRPRAGHHCLLQAGAGGVGLAAGEYAHWLGVRASATAGRPYKHFYLQRLCLQGELLSSRDGSAFALGIAALLRGFRLRFVLNSLSLDFIAVSFATVREDGSLAEIGKRAVWSRERLSSSSIVHYVAIALDSTIAQEAAWMRGALQMLSARARAYVLHGLPLQCFAMERSLQLAFRCLQSGANTGKVVVRIPWTERVAPRRTHLLTGGTGGLGLVTGQWLVEGGAGCVVLASRGGKVSADDAVGLAQLSGCDVRAARCDAVEGADIRRLTAGIRTQRRLAGIWHAAGVLSDGLLRMQTANTIRRVYAPKVHGAWNVQQSCATTPLDAFVLFSSIASLVGGGGQSNYAAANSCLDALGACRRMSGVLSTSVQWGPWADVGMAAGSSINARIQAAGLGLLSLEQGVHAFRAALHPGSPGVVSMVIIRWGKFLGVMPAVPPLLEAYASQKAVSSDATPAGEKRPVSLETIMRVLESTIGSVVDPDAPLMEAGLDSLGAVELGNQLQQESGHTLPSTLIFDYPTARQLAQYFEGTAVSEETAGQSSSLEPTLGSTRATLGVSVRVCGLSSMLPGRITTLHTLQHMMACGGDLITEVPSDRWQVGGDGFPTGVIGQRARYGGFLRNAELFDNSFYGISRAEAAAMDPQQRLLLEYSYAALHGASLQKSNLLGSLTGIFLGIAANDYAEVVRTTPALARSVYAATGTSHSVASGRISFVLGMQGPCASYDTACSAALVANHAALRALQLHECTSALSVGVSMMLLPGVGITFATAGMLSALGHCHTFDARADGYVRGEACCATALRQSSDAPVTPLDLVGSCVRQDGKSASLTAPNGQAQQGLLWAAFADAAMQPSEVATVEAHGTGTALGDPIEARSVVASLFGRGGSNALAMGSVKASSGHAEPAAGSSGLLKLCLGLQSAMAQPNAQLRSINPHVDAALHSFKCALPTQPAAVPTHANASPGMHAGGVSSFGYSGTIVHAVLKTVANAPTMCFQRRLNIRFVYRRYPWPRASSLHQAASVPRQESDHFITFDACWVPSENGMVHVEDAVNWLLLTPGLSDCSALLSRSGLAIEGCDRPCDELRGAIASALGTRPPAHVVMVLNAGIDADPDMQSIGVLLALTAELLKMKPLPVLLCVTRGAQVAQPQEYAAGVSSASIAGCWGFLRCARLEQPAGAWLARDFKNAPSANDLARIFSRHDSGLHSSEAVLGSHGVWHLPRLRRNGTISQKTSKLEQARSLITGGLGGLGLRAASALITQGATCVILASRSGCVARAGQGLQGQLDYLMSCEAQVRICACDVIEPFDCVELLRIGHSMHDHSASIRIIHAAGVLGDALLRKMTQYQLAKVFQPKAQAASNLHSGTSSLALAHFIVFSSVAAAFGNIGQANYAGANAYLDSLATLRQASGLVSRSLQLPPIAGAGMGEELAFRLKGKVELWTLSLDAYSGWLLEALAACSTSVCTALSSEPEHLKLLPEQARMLLADDALGRTIAAKPHHDTPIGTMAGMTSQKISAMLLEEVRALTNITDLTLDTPLMDAGVDSMAALELRNRIEDVIGVRLRNEDLLAGGDDLTIAQLTSAIEMRAAEGSLETEAHLPNAGASRSLELNFLNTSVAKDAAAPAPARLGKRILFVLSSPRSGSSLLQLCLQANPRLYAGQELYLLMFDTMGERQAVPEMKYVDEGLVKTVMELLGVTASMARNRIQLFGDDCPTWRVYSALQLMAGERILVDKTPANASHINFMYRAYDIFSAARYVHLIRHPYACISSGLQMFRDFLDVSQTTWTMVEQSWVETNCACNEFLEFISRQHAYARQRHSMSMQLRYEDFLRDPVAATRDICDQLLLIKWVPGMADPYETSAVASFQAAESKSTTDQKLLKRKRIEPKQAEKWRSVELPQPLLEASKQLAQAYKYQLLPDVVPELKWLAQPHSDAGGPPVVCLHDFTGLLWGFRALAPQMSRTGSLGIQSSTRLVQGCCSMQDLAAKYVDLLPMALWSKDEPIRLVAYSLGCRIAYWMACILEADGRKVELVLLDGPALGDEGYPPRMGGYAEHVAAEIRGKMGLPPPEGNCKSRAGENGKDTAQAAMLFAVMKRSGSFKMLLDMLEEAGEDAAATAVQLIEMPDVVARPLGPLHSPVLFVCTQQMRDNGTADVLIKRIPHAVVHSADGDHFSFITKSAAVLSELMKHWPNSGTP